jgi:hypothetical protein
MSCTALCEERVQLDEIRGEWQLQRDAAQLPEDRRSGRRGVDVCADRLIALPREYPAASPTDAAVTAWTPCSAMIVIVASRTLRSVSARRSAWVRCVRRAEVMASLIDPGSAHAGTDAQKSLSA